MPIAPPLPKFNPRQQTATRRRSSDASIVVVFLALVAALYFGREIFVPIALAVLLSFALAPLVLLLRRCHLPRVAAVTVVVIATFLVIFGIGAMVTQQVAQLAENLPRYQITIGNKIESLRGAASENGIVEKVSNALGGLRQQLTKPTSPSGGSSIPSPSNGTSSSGEQKPIAVE